MLLLTGCTAQETFETIGQLQDAPVIAEPWAIGVDVPDGLSLAASQTEGKDALYLCDDYTVTTHITESGDLNNTFQAYTGFTLDALQVVKAVDDGFDRYDGVWTCASETGDQVGRIAVIDDGKYHYVLTAMADAPKAGDLAEVWQMMFRSFRVEEPGSIVNSGS